METGNIRNTLITELTKSPHSNLDDYYFQTKNGCKQDPQFLAHLIAWNSIKGNIDDAKVAIPTISLAVPGYPSEYVENSLAHLAKLSPRNLYRAVKYFDKLRADMRQIPARTNVNWYSAGNNKRFRRFINDYLADLESRRDAWTRAAVLHRDVLRGLYAITHRKSKKFTTVLFDRKYDTGSVFDTISKLHNIADGSTLAAANAIREFKIPFLISHQILGKHMKDPDILTAVIQNMTVKEITARMKLLERWGVKNHPTTRVALQEALKKVSKSSQNVGKMAQAIDAVEDEGLKEQLRGVTEKQMKNNSIEGNWLVLCDKSSSQKVSIDMGRHVAATLAKFVGGKVHLVFFDSSPHYIDVSGMDFDRILVQTKSIAAQGATSIGVGLDYIKTRNIEVDGIAIITDAQENTAPFFAQTYQEYVKQIGKVIPVYMYRTNTGQSGWADRDLEKTCALNGIAIDEFDIRKGVDVYSLPNLVQTMRTNRYSLIDEIMDTPLLSLSDVFKKKKERVLNA